MTIDDLAKSLEPGRPHILYSETDDTVWPDNAKLSDADRTALQLRLVQETSVGAVGHSEICASDRTIDYICEQMSELLPV